jgi:AraC family transcriptional regulator of adaptative response / DNA-3-methyladenine glycosylase II
MFALPSGDGAILAGLEWLTHDGGARAAADRAGRAGWSEATVGVLAARLGIGERHLARLFTRHLGASPGQIAKTARVQRAKRLLDTTDLPVSQVALAAGFGSLRRCNAVFCEVYGRPPTEIRRGRLVTKRPVQ